jgi:hypothetical protein
MSRHFTLEEAESLLPEVNRLLGAAVAAKIEYDEVVLVLRALAERVMLMGGMNINREVALASKARRDKAAERLREVVDRVSEIGCQVKDLDSGLVDFPTLLGDREVYLCWKRGERSIGFWHGDEGFAGRMPVDAEFLRQHRGDEPS